MRHRAPALIAGLALVLGACSTGGDDTEGPEETGAPTSASATEASEDATDGTADAPVVEIPDTPVGEQVTWTIASLVPGAAIDAADADARLAPAVRESTGGAALVQAFTGFATTGPWEPIGYEGDDAAAVVTLRDSAGAVLELSISLAEDGLIEQLFFQEPFEFEAAASWDELTDDVEALPAETTLVVTDVTDPANPEEVFRAGDDGAFPIGSVFKLYVLGAVTDAVAAGTLTWDTPLTLTEDVKSMPSGELQNEPAGTQVTVQEAAEAMIAISDNTATDLLIETVGREAVEAQLAVMGQSDPGLNTPLLTTRELFILGWGDDQAPRQAWADGDETERRAVLEALPAGPPGIDPTTIAETVWQDGLDWFATPADLVAAQLALQEKADTPAGEPLTAILGASPGIEPAVAETFDEVAFKGGSSMGVVALSHYYSGPDGDHVVTVQARSDSQTDTADARIYFGVAQSAAMLLGEG
ncbi:hypothetical protein GCM10025875_24120 [Litorihabitans aurantiacus]|uniref:Serine hydrolase n=2 Tax=Litorihabitans aurantiacus TaxID=1930061 RepID=A0AA37XGK8_9MICO|nr:hypothetical protein GCM10025875_24120 [Litorihabitans aurantiacus]